MPGATTTDPLSPVRVVVTPSQSSYFAGEPFTVTITFTNTRSPEAGPSKPSFQTHKRGAHSISSAPLARPPTSPGNPRSAIAQLASRSKPIDELPRRKGLIGKAPQDLPDLIDQRRRRQLATKSLSVSISPKELEEQLSEGVIASSSRTSYPHSTTPQIPSPLTRTTSLGLASDHPHARKQSVLDGQFTLDVLSPTTSTPPAPYTPTSSTSTFSLSLDPIAEAAAALSPFPSTPTIGLPTIEPGSIPFPPTPTATTPTTTTTPSANSVYAYPPPSSSSRHYGHGHRPAPIGIGQPSTTSRGYLEPPRTAFASTFSHHTNNELILYSYAQLTGTVTISPVPGALPTPEQAQTLHALRSALLSRAVLGGGSMEITPSVLNSPVLPSPKPRLGHGHSRSHSRSSSLSLSAAAGLFSSMLSPTTSLVSSISGTSSPTPSSPQARTTYGSGTSSSSSTSMWRSSSNPMSPKQFSFGFGGGSAIHNPTPSVGFSNNMAGIEDIDPEEPLPTFEIQPAMLAVDLSLAPGESRSYVYTVKLPENLPPTFKGKAFKFSYELVVGTCRAGTPGSGGSPLGGIGSSGVTANSISRVMKVPIRVYNHVCLTRSLRPYDLLWPVGRRQDVGMPGSEARVEESRQKLKDVLNLPQLPSSILLSSLDSIQDYARSLLASLPPPSVPELPSSDTSGRNGIHIKERQLHRSDTTDGERADEGLQITGCREAVEILTRNPKKASYDVNKDGVKVAVLTFTKSAYRLGETIMGVIELNERTSRARVLKLSAILESHETLPSTISPPSSARHLRRTHAESHSSFTLNTLRTTFSLDIPSDASPAFQVRVGTPPSSNPSTPAHSSLPTPGGLEWKVRICLLVGIAAETSLTGIGQDTRFKSLIRDGPRGEWGSSWKATPTNAPMEKPHYLKEAQALRDARLQFTQQKTKDYQEQRSQQSGGIGALGGLGSPKLGMWSKFIVSSLLYGGTGNQQAEREYHDGDILGMDDEDEDILSKTNDGFGHDSEYGPVGYGGLTTLGGVGSIGHDQGDDGYDGIIPDPAGGVGVGVDYGGGAERWRSVKLETVECEVPVKVFPGNTAFKAVDVVFDV